MFRRWINTRLIRTAIVSFYEPVPERDRERLARAVRRDPALRREIAELRGVRRNIRLESPELDVDLTAAVRARIGMARVQPETEPGRRWVGMAGWRPVFYGAAVAAAAILVALPAFWDGTTDRVASRSAARTEPIVSAAAAESPVAGAIAQACRLVENGDLFSARQMLTDTVARYPDDADTGEALAMLADLEFSEFHRFDRAEEYYELLRMRYPEVFMKTRHAAERYALLAESSPMHYEPLYTLVNARKSGDSMAALERLMARYPDSQISREAMRALTAFHVDGSASTADDVIAALQRARARCADPLAAAQFDLALGNLYRDRMNDPERAARYFSAAAACGQEYVARPAREALATLRYPSR